MADSHPGEWIAPLAAKGATARCPSCGSTAGFGVDPSLKFLVNFDAASKTVDVTSGNPVVAVTCNNCGNVRTFSAVALGIVRKD